MNWSNPGIGLPIRWLQLLDFFQATAVLDELTQSLIDSQRHVNFWMLYFRILKGGGVQGEGVFLGTLRIRREDWGTLGNIRND